MSLLLIFLFNFFFTVYDVLKIHVINPKSVTDQCRVYFYMSQLVMLQTIFNTQRNFFQFSILFLRCNGPIWLKYLAFCLRCHVSRPAITQYTFDSFSMANGDEQEKSRSLKRWAINFVGTPIAYNQRFGLWQVDNISFIFLHGSWKTQLYYFFELLGLEFDPLLSWIKSCETTSPT